MFVSANPYTGEVIKEYEEDGMESIARLVSRASQAQKSWKLVPIKERIQVVNTLASLLQSHIERHAKLVTQEMGKPISEARAELKKCVQLCQYYAENAEQQLEDQIIASSYGESKVKFQPLGLVLAIMPWNFPFWQVFRCAIPAIVSGNGVLLKHASNVSGCSKAMDELFNQCDFPKGLFTSLLISKESIEKVIEHPSVASVSLTGSVGAGKAVAAIAGRNLKKCVLELGGSDAYIILDDCDIEYAARQCVASRLINNGQSCIAAKRFIVESKVENEFLEAVIDAMKAYRMGDPMDDSSQLSVMARRDLKDELAQQVQATVQKGARFIAAQNVSAEKLPMHDPGILKGVWKGMPAYEQELFGPVASLITVENRDQALEVARDSVFGLGGAVFTSDLLWAQEHAALMMETGSICINDFVRSDPCLPFGGVKQSGYGRELSAFGIREFTNIQTVATGLVHNSGEFK